jgi:preprotein translocase subunit SecF
VFLATPFEVALREREPAIREHTKKVLDARAARVAGGEDEPVGPDLRVAVGALKPGAHLGNAAQPKRKR